MMLYLPKSGRRTVLLEVRVNLCYWTHHFSTGPLPLIQFHIGIAIVFVYEVIELHSLLVLKYRMTWQKHLSWLLQKPQIALNNQWSVSQGNEIKLKVISYLTEGSNGILTCFLMFDIIWNDFSCLRRFSMFGSSLWFNCNIKHTYF